MSQTEPSSITLAILGGTGKEGPGLAMRWGRAGYRIIIGSRQPEKAQATAAALNAQLKVNIFSGMDNNSAFRAADLCVMTVVWTAHRDFLLSLKDEIVEGAVKGKILIDATARVDFRNPQPPPPPSAARQAQEILGPDVRVVAAFQNVPAHLLKKNLDEPLGIDVLVCSDDPTAAQTVIELAQAGGMRAFYAGNLDNAVVVEGLTCILINLNQQYGVKTASINFSGLPE
jgi:8-hydroxy-5-deazaflavin:NADPH oxidoreductase